jgi:hypothetical protein
MKRTPNPNPNPYVEQRTDDRIDYGTTRVPTSSSFPLVTIALTSYLVAKSSRPERYL